MTYAQKTAGFLAHRKYGITAFETIDSTNLEAKRQISTGVNDAHVIIADSQTDGRGRMGRSFFSPAGSGIYISYIKELPENTENLPLLTSFAGIAVCNAIESMLPDSAPQCKIKWPNDIYIKARKICGILTSLVTDTKSNRISHAIVGIGINVTSARNDFPEELWLKAGSILSQTNIKLEPEEVCAKLITELDKLFFEEQILNKKQPNLIETLRTRSMTIGHDVEFNCDGQRLMGRATDINTDGSLLVTGNFGQKNVSSGEAVVLI
ncbi:MAG: biotin--[Clostridia bacterium]|nr:biotin--[acetyl-CoA-carboxylase] ligase [Clostridia bacterium]